MNYIERPRGYWNVFRNEAPDFVNRRVDALVASKFLEPSGQTGHRSTYAVIGSTDEYDRGGEILIKSFL